MKNYLLTLPILFLLTSCEKDNSPITIENYLNKKVINKIATNPSGSKVFFLSATIDPQAPSWMCSIPYIYQLSCTDGEHTLYFENLHSVRDIAVDESCNLYACMYRNLIKFMPPKDSSTILQSDHLFSTVATDTSGKIWAGTYDGGVYYYDNHTWQHYTSANSSLTENNIQDIEIGINNDIWISVEGDTSSVTYISEGVFKTYTWKELIGKNISYVTQLAVDKNGVVWATYSDNGNKLVSIDKNGNLTNQHVDFIDNKTIIRLGSDFSGNIYMITYTDIASQLYIYNGFSWNEAILDANNTYVSDIALDAGNNLWIGTQNGIKKTELRYLNNSD